MLGQPGGGITSSDQQGGQVSRGQRGPQGQSAVYSWLLLFGGSLSIPAPSEVSPIQSSLIWLALFCTAIPETEVVDYFA